MNNKKSLLSLLAAASSAIDKGIDSLQAQKTTSEQLVIDVEKKFTKVTIKTIDEVAAGNSGAIREYENFLAAVLQRFMGDEDRVSFMVDTKTRYLIAENSVAQAYILAAYLIRVQDIKSAESILIKKVRGKLENHYISRTVYTLRSRAGLEKYSRGWCIGIGERIFKQNKDLQSIFFHDNEQFIDLLCQVDFLQYYLEFKKSGDLYHGYPNFLYYPKERTAPLFDSLVESGESQEQVEDVARSVAQINAGEFFTQNQWRR